MNDIQDSFLVAVKQAYNNYLVTSSRSNKKLKPLHGWVMDELRKCLDNPEYKLEGLSETSKSERTVAGKYYDKNCDVVISRDDFELGVVSIKFPVSSYKKNKINQFEQQLGETANLRMKNIVFGHLCVFPDPLPTMDKKTVKGWELISDDIIDLYVKLASDHQKEHAPDVQGVVVVKFTFSDSDSTATTLDKVLKTQGGKVQSVRYINHNELPRMSRKNWNNLQNLLSLDRFIDVMCNKLKTQYRDLSSR